VHDPLAIPEHAVHEYGINLTSDADLAPADAVVLAVAHDAYMSAGWPAIVRLLKNGRGVVIDVKARLDRKNKPADVELWRL
jgi:UDP-N-acetyl-D-glucosamine/UDP-N-acetyl-D-galactosamine dehydrogenase